MPKPRFLLSLFFTLPFFVSVAFAQDPGFPQKGKHYDYSVMYGHNATYKKIYNKYGIILAKSGKGRKLMLLDLTGKQIISYAFDYIYPMSSELATATDLHSKKWVLIDIPNKSILGSWHVSQGFQSLISGEIIKTISSTKAVLCKLKGAKLVPISAIYSKIRRHSLPGRFWAMKNNKWGVVSVGGEVLVPFQYSKIEWIGDYGNTRLRVTSENGSTGIIEPNGRQVMALNYRIIDDPVNDVSTWFKGTKLGATNLKTGEVLFSIPASGHRLSNIDGEYFSISKQWDNDDDDVYRISWDKSYRIYRARYGYLSEDSFTSISYHITPNGPLFMTESTQALLAGQAKPLRNKHFTVVANDLSSILMVGKDFVVARNSADRKMLLLDFNGNTIVDASRFIVLPKVPEGKYLSYFGRVPVQSDNKFGYANLMGKDIIAPQFKAVTTFNKYGIAAVKADTGWGLINKNGEYIVKPRFAATFVVPELPFYILQTKDGENVLYSNEGEEYFRADKRFRFNLMSSSQLQVQEVVDGKTIRSFHFVLK